MRKTNFSMLGDSTVPALSRSNLDRVPENTPTELLDFSNGSSQLKNIEIIQRITNGPVTIGRYLLPPNPGVFLGATQYAVMVMEGSPVEIEWLPPGSQDYERKRIEHGNVDILPSDTLLYQRWETSSRTMFIAIDKIFVKQIVEQAFAGNAVELKPYIGLRDPIIEGMAQAWRGELEVRGTGGRIQAEALATALVVHVFRTYGEGGATPKTLTGGMSGTRLRRVTDYIESNLTEEISLGSLASLAGFSIHHFNDVFKAETGYSPHRYIIERRIHRAKELLLTNDSPIAQIAVDLGFSGQSHFTEHFRKSTGTTPLRFRRARKQ